MNKDHRRDHYLEEQVPDASVMEVTEVTSPLESPEVESPSVSEPAEQSESQPETPDTPPAEPDGRSFAGKLRDHYKELMATNDPAKVQLAKAFKDMFFQNKALRDKFPGGLKEVEEKLGAIQELGTPDEIKDAREAAQVLDQMDSKWLAADPAFIDELVTLNPESFKKLAPIALQKFAQVAPEEYQRVMSGILSSTLAQAKMGDQLYLISRELQRGDTQEALRLIKQIEEWMGGLDAAAKAPAPQTPADDPRAAELRAQQEALDEKQAEFFNRQLATEVTGWRDSQIRTALAKITNGTKIDPERMEIFQDRVIRELVRLHPANFEDTWNRHYAQGDQATLIKFIQGVDGPNISKAVAKVHALLFPGAKKAPVTVPAAQPANGNGSRPADSGWIKVSTRPNPQEIDRGRGRTTDEMIFAGKAVLRNGKKVMWDR